MSKKQFIELANAIRNMGTHDDGETVNVAAVIETLADFCASQNSNFNRQRWISYIKGECGPCGGEVRHSPMESY